MSKSKKELPTSRPLRTAIVKCTCGLARYKVRESRDSNDVSCPKCVVGYVSNAELLMRTDGSDDLDKDKLRNLIAYWHTGAACDYIANFAIRNIAEKGQSVVVIRDHTFSSVESVQIQIENDIVKIDLANGQIPLRVDDSDEYAIAKQSVWFAESEVARVQLKKPGIVTSTYCCLGVVRSNGEFEIDLSHVFRCHKRVTNLLSSHFPNVKDILTAGRIYRELMKERRFVPDSKSHNTDYTAMFDWSGKNGDLKLVESVEAELKRVMERQPSSGMGADKPANDKSESAKNGKSKPTGGKNPGRSRKPKWDPGLWMPRYENWRSQYDKTGISRKKYATKNGWDESDTVKAFDAMKTKRNNANPANLKGSSSQK